MAYTQIVYHIVIRPKDSKPVFPPEYERELFAYMVGVLQARKSHVYRINGMPDHIHLLISLHPTIALADLVRDLKIACGNFLRSHPDKFPKFTLWGETYGAVTCRYDDIETVRQYIIRQKEHHTKVSFADEFKQFLAENGIELDAYLPNSTP